MQGAGAGRDGDAAEEDLVLVTAHRRESFGEPLERVVRAIGRLAYAFPATRFVHVLHPNPNVAPVVRQSVLAAEGPAFTETLNKVSALLTTKALEQMNAAVSIDKQTAASVAQQFLRANGLS